MARISAAQRWMWISRSPSRELCSPVVDLELTLALPSPPAPPKACNVVACDCGIYLFGGAGAGRRQGVAAAGDGHKSLEKGHTTGDNNPEPWPLMTVDNAENRLVNASVAPAENDGWAKRRRVPTPAAGSQCSRSNGKGWRCRKTTQGGSCLCEHHRSKDLDRIAATRLRRRAAALARATAAAPAPQQAE